MFEKVAEKATQTELTKEGGDMDRVKFHIWNRGLLSPTIAGVLLVVGF